MYKDINRTLPSTDQTKSALAPMKISIGLILFLLQGKTGHR